MRPLARRWLTALTIGSALCGETALAGELDLHIYGLSYHPDREGARRQRLDNEVNLGLGLGYEFHNDARGVAFVHAGAYNDSGRNLAKIAGPGYQFKIGERLRLGGALFAVHSKTYNRGAAFVTPIPMATYDFGAVKLNAIYAPRMQQNEFAVFGFFLSVPLSR